MFGNRDNSEPSILTAPLIAPPPLPTDVLPPAAKAGISTVDTLFHNMIYEIPSYQREFSWEAKQVKALIGDLIESYQSKIPGGQTPQYFLGAIVTQVRQLNDEGEVDVADKIVDGQQRITSLLLVIAVLCKHIRSTAEDNPEQGGEFTRKQAELLNLIFRPDEDHFVLNVPGYNYFVRRLMGGDGQLPAKQLGQPPFKTSALQKFEKAFDLFETHILTEIGHIDPDDEADDKPDRNLLLDFAQWVQDCVFVALIADTDPYDDQRLFDRMNTRGLPLSEGDRFKSRVLSASGASERASRLWQKTQEQALQVLNSADQAGSLAIRDSREAERRLLGGWAIATCVDLTDISDRKLKQVRAIELDPYHFCLQHFGSSADEDASKDIYARLKSKYFLHVRRLKSADPYDGVYQFLPKLAGLQHAQIMKLPHLDAIIATCFVSYPTKHAKQRLAVVSGFLDLVAFHRAWNRGWASKSRLEKLGLEAIATINTTGIKDLRQRLGGLLGSLPHIDVDTAPGLMPANQRWMRYFLGRLAYDLEERATGKKANQEYIDGVGRRAPEIEHIFSRRFNDDGSAFGFRRDQIEVYRQRLGALTLLAREDNRAASNRSWTERTEIYARSNLLTRTLLPQSYDHRLRLVTNSEDLSLLNFEPWEKISPEAIERREIAYTNLARMIWARGAFLSQ